MRPRWVTKYKYDDDAGRVAEPPAPVDSPLADFAEQVDIIILTAREIDGNINILPAILDINLKMGRGLDRRTSRHACSHPYE